MSGATLRRRLDHLAGLQGIDRRLACCLLIGGEDRRFNWYPRRFRAEAKD